MSAFCLHSESLELNSKENQTGSCTKRMHYQALKVWGKCHVYILKKRGLNRSIQILLHMGPPYLFQYFWNVTVPFSGKLLNHGYMQPKLK
jgi:hypothetical protein